MYCLYYQAKVEERYCWFLVAALRSFEHLAFDRTMDKKSSTFEFLVPQENEKYFLSAMQYFVDHNIVTNLQKLPNRLIQPDAEV